MLFYARNAVCELISFGEIRLSYSAEGFHCEVYEGFHMKKCLKVFHYEVCENFHLKVFIMNCVNVFIKMFEGSHYEICVSEVCVNVFIKNI